jgi:hypothetical protein
MARSTQRKSGIRSAAPGGTESQRRAGSQINIANLKRSLPLPANGVGSTPATLKKKNIGPRFGFAYRWAKTGARRGLYYSDPNNDIFQTPGYSTSTSIVTRSMAVTADRQHSQQPLSPASRTDQFQPGVTFAGKNNNWFDSGA